MKKQLKTIKIFTLALTMLFFSNCTMSDNSSTNENQTQEILDFRKSHSNLNKSVSELFNKSNSRINGDSSLDLADEQTAISVLSPYMQSSLDFLYDHGFTQTEIIEEFGSLSNPAIIASADYINKIELTYPPTLSVDERTNSNTYKVGDDPDMYDCLLRAAGIDAVIEIFNGKLSKQIAKKAIRKIIVKYVGWIGAAVAIYEFGDCMEWY